jgi:hypothetical protein
MGSNQNNVSPASFSQQQQNSLQVRLTMSFYIRHKQVNDSMHFEFHVPHSINFSLNKLKL